MDCNEKTCGIDIMSIYTYIPGITGPIGDEGEEGSVGATGVVGTVGHTGANGADGNQGKAGCFITEYRGTTTETNAIAYEYLYNQILDTAITASLNTYSLIQLDLKFKIIVDAGNTAKYKILVNDIEYIELTEANAVDTYHNISMHIMRSPTTPSGITYSHVKTFKTEQLVSASTSGDAAIIYYPNEGESSTLVSSDLQVKILGMIDSATGIPSATEYIKLEYVSIKIIKA